MWGPKSAQENLNRGAVADPAAMCNSRLPLSLQSESDAVALLKKTDENYYNKRQIFTFVVERKNRSVEEVNHASF